MRSLFVSKKFGKKFFDDAYFRGTVFPGIFSFFLKGGYFFKPKKFRKKFFNDAYF